MCSPGAWPSWPSFRVSAEALSSETCLPCPAASPSLSLRVKGWPAPPLVLASSGEAGPLVPRTLPGVGGQISSSPAPASLHSKILQMLSAPRCKLNSPAAFKAGGGTCPEPGLTSVTQPHLPRQHILWVQPQARQVAERVCVHVCAASRSCDHMLFP